MDLWSIRTFGSPSRLVNPTDYPIEVRNSKRGRSTIFWAQIWFDKWKGQFILFIWDWDIMWYIYIYNDIYIYIYTLYICVYIYIYTWRIFTYWFVYLFLFFNVLGNYMVCTGGIREKRIISISHPQVFSAEFDEQYLAEEQLKSSWSCSNQCWFLQ